MYSKITFFFLINILVSCGGKPQQQFNLSKEDYSWQPYKKNDLLVFKSNEGVLDTLRISKIEIRKMPRDPLDLLPNIIESLHVYVSDIENGEDDKFLHEILEISSYGKDTTLLSYSLGLKKACFYNDNNGHVESLMSGDSFKLQEKVHVMTSRDTTYNFRDNFIDKLYWSKSKGILGYDMRKGDKWRIVSPAVP